MCTGCTTVGVPFIVVQRGDCAEPPGRLVHGAPGLGGGEPVAHQIRAVDIFVHPSAHQRQLFHARVVRVSKRRAGRAGWAGAAWGGGRGAWGAEPGARSGGVCVCGVSEWRQLGRPTFIPHRLRLPLHG